MNRYVAVAGVLLLGSGFVVGLVAGHRIPNWVPGPDVRIVRTCDAGATCAECGCPAGTYACGTDKEDPSMGFCKRLVPEG